MTNGNNHSNNLFFSFDISHIQVGIHRTMQGHQGHSDERKFLNYINDHYQELYHKYRQFCREKNYSWDEDIFQNTIVKCHDAIKRKGKLNDTTPQGIENYFFISFKLNLKREGQYARNQKRDLNVTSDDVNELYETWVNNNVDSSRAKLISDLFKDFATLYIATVVEENFDQEDFYLFKLKTLCNMTYKELYDKTGIKKARQRVCDVKNWLKENVKKEDVNKAFQAMYGDIL